MASTSPLRVAVVGLGWAARSIWLPCLTADPRFTVTAAVDPAAEARERTELPPGCDPLERPDQLDPAAVDFAVVAVPNHLHAAVAAPLLESGVPVFLEKPVCLSAAEVERLRQAEQRGAVLLAGSAARHRSDVAALARVLPSLGPVRHMEVSWIRARGIPRGDGWFTDQRLAGGGALVDLGWHLLDVGFALLGTEGVRHVIGSLSADFLSAGTGQADWRADGPPPDGVTGDVEDGARVMLVTDDGVSVMLRTSWASHLAHDLTGISVESRAGSARLDCTFGFSPNRVSRSTLTVLRDGVREEVPLAADPVGQEYHRQVAMLPAALADPGQRGRAVADAARTVRVIEQVYGTATVLTGPPAVAEPPPATTMTSGPLPVVNHLSEVQALESAIAAAARGERFLLHTELPASGPRIASAMRLALLNALGLAYGAGSPVVTLLEWQPSEPVSPADQHHRMLRIAQLLRPGGGGLDEITRTQQRLARLRSGDGSMAPFILRQLKSALAFVQANGGRMAAIEKTMRAATYLAGRAPSESPDWVQRDRLTGRAYAIFAHALTGPGLPADATNPVIMRVPPGTDPGLLRYECARLDPSRSPGRLVIVIGTVDGLADLIAVLRREAHRPAWLCRYDAAAGGPARLHAAADALADAGEEVAGVSIPAIHRQMEHVAAIAQMFADRSTPDRVFERRT